MTRQRKMQLAGIVLAVVALFTTAAAVSAFQTPSPWKQANSECSAVNGLLTPVYYVGDNSQYLYVTESGFVTADVSVGDTVCQVGSQGNTRHIISKSYSNLSEE